MAEGKLSLGPYIAGAMERPWDWVSVNCGFFAADWVLAATGIDPAIRWRGRLSGRVQAKLRTDLRGGLARVAMKEMDRAGFVETAEPKFGDVGIVRVPTGVAGENILFGDVCAIRSRGLWLVRGLNDLVGYDFQTVKAWAL